MDQTSAPVPRYVIAKIYKLRDKLADEALFEFCGFEPKGAHFEELVGKICEALPRVPFQTIFDSVRDVAGKVLTKQDLRDLSWRLAGNLSRLRDGVVVPPWTHQHEYEWAPVQIIEYHKYTDQKSRPCALYRMRYLAGTPCPLIIQTTWPTGFCKLLSSRAGFTAPWREYPFIHNSELVNMRFMVLLDPDRCTRGQPNFKDIGCTSSMRDWNRRIIQRRNRRKGEDEWPCPRGYDHPCYMCPVGYHDCTAGCHPQTLTVEQMMKEFDREQ